MGSSAPGPLKSSDLASGGPVYDDPMLGRVLDARYRVESVLGSGGVGVVYRAEHTGLRRPVALKVLRHGYDVMEDQVRRFEREATALSALTHPHIVGITDFGVFEGSPYLCMELLEGRTLGDLLDDDGPPDPQRSLDILRAVLRALAYVHQRGVLHRDLKPANVFLQRLPDDPDYVKLLDFGMAKLLEHGPGNGAGEPTLTQAGTVLGTPSYMSPEQASGARVDERTDVYSAGILLFELLVGRVPFVERTRTELFRAHMVSPVPSLESLRPGLVVTPELRQLIERALAKEPGCRFADANAMLAAIDALPRPAAKIDADRASGLVRRVSPDSTSADGPTIALPSKPRASAATRPARGLPGGPWVALAGIAALVIGLVGGVALYLGSADEVPPPTPVVVAPTPAPPVEPTPASSDPFSAEVSGELEPFVEMLRIGTPFDRVQQRQLRRIQRTRADDPRPSLLLAHDMVARNWMTGAVERYDLAYGASETAKNDPRMLDGLLRAAASESAHRSASDLLERLYGGDAVAALDQARAASEQRPVRSRLARLRRQLLGDDD